MRKFILVLLLTTVFSSPAFGQSKKELAAQDSALADRLSRLESRMLTGDPAAEQLMQRMDALESEQRNLTGEIEQLRFERDKLKTEISALNAAFETLESESDRMRLHLNAVDLVEKERAERQQFAPAPVTNYDQPNYNSGSVMSDAPSISDQLSGFPSAPVLKEFSVEPGQVPGNQVTTIVPTYPDLSTLPEAGKRKLYEGNFSGAQSDFQTYLAVAADAPNAGEVRYWLGETFFVKGGYADAADSYIESMRKDPQGIKAPEALIRLGASLRELGKQAEACQALGSFNGQFPGADAEIRDKASIELARTGC